MKKLIQGILLFAILSVSFSSCVSQKEVVYFQNSDSLFAHVQTIAQNYDMKIKPADRLSVSISCSETKLLTPYASNITMGTNEGNVNTSSSQSREVYTGYTVDASGYVSLPVLGKVKAQGYTEEEFAKVLEKLIIEHGINDPQVTVKFTNASVSVLGAVRSPGRIALNSKRTSILDVLASAGDITDSGLKKNIKLFREVDGKRMQYVIDLRQSDVFNSPAYYVQQNDLIYVEPNRTAQVKNSPFFTIWSASASIASVVISITSLILAITR
ncbi:MAG: polysaccharide biosynthesis/export family protein [Bacteroidaceae bacterium]|jgi:polysaccharide export outer membrane protein|nr:polysaccharide biosynthesis/export family protein [Bacteroidaceae bacterium]